MILLQRLRATNFKQLETIDLLFPQSGTLLIEGRNEAGKSTLFEAIFYALYGAMVGDTTPQEAIRYGCEFLEVTLDFSIEGRCFSVTRRQGGRATASLTFPGVNGEQERTSTVSGVNRQITDELSLSAQGLRNTCFVEQKKLEHLESLNPSQRQAAINELVNLSAFDRIAKGFPSEAEERRLESAARLRLMVAQLDTDFVELESKLERLRPLYAVAQLSALHTQQETCRADAEKLQQDKEHLDTVIALKRRSAWLKDIVSSALSAWETTDQALTSASSAVAAAETARKQLSALGQEVLRLGGLKETLEQYRKYHEEQKRQASWATSQKVAGDDVARLAGALSTAKTTWESALAALDHAEKHRALTLWAKAWQELQHAESDALDPEQVRLEKLVEQATTANAEAQDRAAAMKKAAEAQESHAHTVATQNRQEIQALQSQSEPLPAAFNPTPAPTPPAGNKATLGIALMGIGVALAIFASISRLWVLFAPALGLLVWGGALFAGHTGAQKAYQEAVRQHQVHERQAQEAARQAQESARAAWEQARQKITSLQAAIDQANAEAHAARAGATEAADRYQKTLAAVAEAERALAEYRVTHDRSARLPVLRNAVEQAEAALKGLSLPVPSSIEAALEQAGPPPALPLDTLRRNVREAQQAHSVAQEALSAAQARIMRYTALYEFTQEQLAEIQQAPAQLKEAGFSLESEELTEAWTRAERARYDAQRLADSLPDKQRALEAAMQSSAQKKAAFQQVLVDSGAAKPLPETAADAGELLLKLQQEVRDSEARQSATLTALTLPDLQQELARLSQREGANQQTLEDLERQESAPRQVLNLPSAAMAPLATLMPELHEAHPAAWEKEAAQWQEELCQVEEQRQANRVERSTHASTAQLTPKPLDLATERAHYDKCLFSRDVHAQAKRILSLTRESILNRVMPSTMNVTRRILPLLTEGRYRDVQWSIDSNLIEVMDMRKGDWAVKKVFSGGTRDQISLALRLSFVLATLPNHKATRPGWLFLDEPLSSFDATRSESLIKLLTAPGSLIRPRFPQIFLISHGVAADPSRFDYHLVMDGGKISPASRLPVA